MDLTSDDREQIAKALEREISRLETSLREYRSYKDRTRNASVKAMADEGATSTTERIISLKALVNKIRGTEPPKASTGIGGRVRET